jgi:nucleoid DNA-binding protein|tara:strand:+ start:194 stop:478 length:285 start_codon:yes stop_codon:yes gene_type:complete
MKRTSNTKKDISLNLSKITGFPYSLSNKLNNDLLDTIICEIKNKKLIIQGIGTFILIQKNQRIGRNPKTKEEFVISKRKAIRFVVSKKLIDKLN